MSAMWVYELVKISLMVLMLHVLLDIRDDQRTLMSNISKVEQRVPVSPSVIEENARSR